MAQTVINCLLLILFIRSAHTKSEFVSNPSHLRKKRAPEWVPVFLAQHSDCWPVALLFIRSGA